jgi:hypothetical protein
MFRSRPVTARSRWRHQHGCDRLKTPNGWVRRSPHGIEQFLLTSCRRHSQDEPHHLQRTRDYERLLWIPHLSLWTTRRLSRGTRGLGLFFELLRPRSSVFLDVARLGLFVPRQIRYNERSFVGIVELGFDLPDTCAYLIGSGRLRFEASGKERLLLRAAEETLRVTAFGLSHQ